MSSPHDGIFKAAFGQPEVARSELQLLLPAEVCAQLDLSTLEVCPGSFVDEELRATHADLLYTVRTRSGPAALVYVLFEHQSTNDATMPFRLLRYMIRVWERWLRDNPNAAKLPLVLPLLLHNGESGWRSGTDFASMLDASPQLLAAARPFQPMFQFVLDDLAELTAEAILARGLHAVGRLTQLGLWARSMERLQSATPAMRTIARSLARDARTRALLTQFYVYLWRTAPPEVEADQIRAILLEVAGAEGAEDVVNAGEQLIAEGERRGLERGLEQGLERGLEKGLEQGLAGLRAGITTAFSARSIALSDLGRARPSSCTDVAILPQWLARAVSAASEAEMFAGNGKDP